MTTRPAITVAPGSRKRTKISNQRGREARGCCGPFSWPAGAHVAIVEVDTETGAVELLRYIAVDDVGTVVNPTIVAGQIMGGLAQGVAQALYEEAIYDEDGNLLTGNMVT